jgi:flagellar hook-basal body complex protein FliE
LLRWSESIERNEADEFFSTVWRKRQMQPAPNTDALDQQFKEFIQALKGAVNSAMPHLKDDPKVVDKAITDCKEILDVVMEGDVKEWLS